MSRIARTVAWLASLALAALAQSATAQTDVPANVRRVAGCYAAQVGPRVGSFPWGPDAPEWARMPTAFRLAAIPDSTLAQIFTKPPVGWYRLEPSRPHKDTRFNIWRPVSGDSVELEWGSGFTGLGVRLAISGDTLRGRAKPFWDSHTYPEPPPPTEAVVATRTDCSAQSLDSVMLERSNCAFAPVLACTGHRTVITASGERRRSSETAKGVFAAPVIDTVAGTILDSIRAQERALGFRSLSPTVTCSVIATDADTITVGIFDASPLSVSYYAGCLDRVTMKPVPNLQKLMLLAQAIDSAAPRNRE